MDAALAALAGAGIGAVASIAGVWLQQRAQTRRDLTKTAADLAVADFTHKVELAKLHRSGVIAPISAYVAYRADVLRAVADGRYTPAKIAEIDRRQQEVIAAIYSVRSSRE